MTVATADSAAAPHMRGLDDRQCSSERVRVRVGDDCANAIDYRRGGHTRESHDDNARGRCGRRKNHVREAPHVGRNEHALLGNGPRENVVVARSGQTDLSHVDGVVSVSSKTVSKRARKVLVTKKLHENLGLLPPLLRRRDWGDFLARQASRVGQRGEDIVPRELRKTGEDSVDRVASRQVIEHHVDRHPRATDAGLPAADVGVGHDARFWFHALQSMPAATIRIMYYGALAAVYRLSSFFKTTTTIIDRRRRTWHTHHSVRGSVEAGVGTSLQCLPRLCMHLGVRRGRETQYLRASMFRPPWIACWVLIGWVLLVEQRFGLAGAGRSKPRALRARRSSLTRELRRSYAS